MKYNTKELKAALEILKDFSNLDKKSINANTVEFSQDVLIAESRSGIRANYIMSDTESDDNNISFKVDCKKIIDTIKKFKDAYINIKQLDNDCYSVGNNSSKLKYKCINNDFEYCDYSKYKSYVDIKIKSNILYDMIKKTIPFVSESEIKPIHTGLLFELERKSIFNIVAVDGYRLGIRTEYIDHTENYKSIVIPANVCKILLKILKNNKDASVSIAMNPLKAFCVITVKNYIIHVKTIEGKFLDYKQVIPEIHKHKIEIGTEKFINHLDKIDLIINDKEKSPVKFTLKENEINLMCKTPAGEYNGLLTANNYKGNKEAFTIGFNNRYMYEALKYSELNNINVAFTTKPSPIVLTDDAEKLLYLVLPVRLKEE